MTFYADLHVHSKYSRATSRNCDLEHLAIWARKKGIRIVATGDFTHPAWRAELKEKLVPAEPGLFRLRPDLERAVEQQLPAACRSSSTAVRFMLSVEISTIYKKLDKTRKIHHLIYTPDFDSTERVVDSLSRIGNLHSDGRPILGLDSRHLLEIALESGPNSYLVPAHIWTPWFAALGSKSGFDAIDDCYGDLAPHIFAVETGLSSDPPMNWRVSSLDRFRLVSNSDAHSPEKLGREVCVFDTELDYFALRRALETGEGYEGTLEFFPEEGKYHLDGHRHCHVRLSPGETRKHEGRCPACGKPLTVGVMHRVEDLAERPEEVAPPETAGTMQSLIPLPEILSEIHRVGPKSKRVAQHYESLLGRLGPELQLLNTVSLEDIEPAASTLVAEAVSRLRRQEVIRDAGYDGVYGTIRLFQDAELRQRTLGASLFREEKQEERAPEESAKHPPSPGHLAFSPSDMDLRSAANSSPSEWASPPSPNAHGRHLGTSDGMEGSDVAQRPFPGTWASRPHEPSRPFGPSRTGRPYTREDALPGGTFTARQSASQKTSSPQMPSSPGETTSPPASPLRDRSRTRSASNDRSTDPLTGLDDDQRRAVETIGGPLLIVAGPGSGKTRTLTHRIAHLVRSHAVSPARCLAITFTRRAAGEIRDRLRVLLPEAWEQVALHTFHSLGLSILTEHHNAAGLQRGFRVASQAERVQLLRETLDISERRARSRLSAISRVKRTGASPSEDEGSSAAADAAALEAYERAMEVRNLCDFDDLVIRAADALESSPALRAQYRQRYRWISVDEYQDVDEQQVRLLKQLSPLDGNLCVIGDPDQAIYGFRGADVRFFSEFRRDFRGTRVVRLTRNYRSDRNIVALSTQVIGRSGSRPRPDAVAEPIPGVESAPGTASTPAVESALVGKSASAVKPIPDSESAPSVAPAPAVESVPIGEGIPTDEPAAIGGSLSMAEPASDVESVSVIESASFTEPVPAHEPIPSAEPVPIIEDVPDLVTLHEAPTERAEAEFVVQSLERTLGGHSFFSIDSGRSADPEGPDLSFSDFAVLYRTEAQVPALVEALHRSGMPFQHRSHRRLLDHPGVVAAIDGLRSARTEGSVRERLEAVCLGGEGRGDAHRLEVWELLRPAAVACGDDLERFVSDVSLGAEVDTWDPRADRISLLTFHAAKGLEFPVVFIVGCERGLLPLTWGRASRTVLDEERRLFYVGVTRARTKLYLCRAKKRLWRGKIRELPPSPFLADIEERLLERYRSRIPGKQTKADDSQLNLFS